MISLYLSLYTDITIRVTLFSQTGSELYLLNASYKDGYRQYMQGDPGKRSLKQDRLFALG